MFFAVYVLQTGEIVRTGSQPDDWPFDLQAKEGEGVVEGPADAAAMYVKDGALTARPAQRTKISGASLVDLPVPCRVVVNGEQFECVDGRADLVFPYAGVWKVAVEAFPFVKWEAEIEN